MYKTIQKLEAVTDAEFEELYIMPDGMVDDCCLLYTSRCV